MILIEWIELYKYKWMDYMSYIVLLSYKNLMTKSCIAIYPRVYTSRHYGNTILVS